MKSLQPKFALRPAYRHHLFKIGARVLLAMCLGSCGGGSSNSPTTTTTTGGAGGTPASPSATTPAPSTTTPAPTTSGTTPAPSTTTPAGTTTGSTPTAVQAYATDVLMHHNDLARTGQMLAETTLTLANVNSTAFGKLRFLPADGKVDGQPLFVTRLTMGTVVHNVVYVVT